MSNKKGFTLIELLIVVVIIGILAAIAIPKFAKTKEKAYVAAMKSDLRNLATYEEQYAADNNGAYFADGPITGPNPFVGPGVGFTPSKDVTITAALVAGGWEGTATHGQLQNPVITCTMKGGVIAGC
jgi:prepilin-type N-terminal cleavage/methylation domain-containing protein